MFSASVHDPPPYAPGYHEKFVPKIGKLNETYL